MTLLANRRSAILLFSLPNCLESHRTRIVIKEKEIQDLTEAALKRPNDYSMWWATGGFVVGIATVLGILWATK